MSLGSVTNLSGISPGTLNYTQLEYHEVEIASLAWLLQSLWSIRENPDQGCARTGMGIWS